MSYVYTGDEAQHRDEYSEDAGEAVVIETFSLATDPEAFWQRPTFTERDLSEARSDAWDRGYVSGVLDLREAMAEHSVSDYGAGYLDGYRRGLNAAERNLRERPIISRILAAIRG